MLDKPPEVWYTKSTKGERVAKPKRWDPRESVRPLSTTPAARCACVRYTNVNQCHRAEEMVDYAGYKATPVLLGASLWTVGRSPVSPQVEPPKSATTWNRIPESLCDGTGFSAFSCFNTLNGESLARRSRSWRPEFQLYHTQPVLSSIFWLAKYTNYFPIFWYWLLASSSV